MEDQLVLASKDTTATARILARAAEMYHGDFLAGFFVSGCPGFEGWVRHERERLRRIIVERLHTLILHDCAHGLSYNGITHAVQLLQIDPVHEVTHRYLMQFLVQTGQRAEALRQFEVCRDTLADELGVEPDDATTDLYYAIRDGATITVRLDAPVRHNLPAQLTPIVGRVTELAQLADLLTRTRLITLTGPGGIGKTRLALEAAAGQVGQFRDGVFFVPLATLQTAAAIPSAILRTLEQSPSTSQPVDSFLLNILRDRQLLLVLDNFEHLLDGAPFVSEMLASAPDLSILATSRECLSLSGEVVLPVGALALPDDNDTDDLFSFSALRLFFENAWYVRSDFAPEQDKLSHAARICRLVDGIPLGVILAALWTNTLSLQEIADELEDGLDFLSADARDLPARHRSLRAVFDSSWRWLTGSERAAMMRLSVFKDGFTRRAGQQVSGASLPVLQKLVNKSLVQRNPVAGRFELHALVRQLAFERLVDCGEEEAVRQAHARHFLIWLTAQSDALTGPGQIEALDAIDADYENVRTAWLVAAAAHDATLIDGALEPLALFSELRRDMHQRRELLMEAVPFFAPAAGKTPGRIWVRLRARTAPLDDIEAALNQIEMCFDLARAAGDEHELAYCLLQQGSLGGTPHDRQSALRFLEEARERFHALGDDYWTAVATLEIANTTMHMGHLSDWAYHMHEFDAEARAIGAPDLLGKSVFLFAILAQWADGDYDEAERRIQAAHRLHLAAGHRYDLLLYAMVLGRNAFFRGDFARARDLYDAHRDDIARLRSEHVSSTARAGEGVLAGWAGQYDDAQRLGQESIALMPEHSGTLVTAHLAVAVAEWGLGNTVSAWDHLRAGLRIAIHLRMSASQSWYLGIAALLLAADGETVHAAEVLALAFAHPASPTGWFEGWSALAMLRSNLADALGQETFDTASAQGQSREIATVAQVLLSGADDTV